ncbi:hypothetical protein OY671_012778, partial [Metschnikowia pulcherrima]
RHGGGARCVLRAGAGRSLHYCPARAALSRRIAAPDRQIAHRHRPPGSGPGADCAGCARRSRRDGKIAGRHGSPDRGDRLAGQSGGYLGRGHGRLQSRPCRNAGAGKDARPAARCHDDGAGALETDRADPGHVAGRDRQYFRGDAPHR